MTTSVDIDMIGYLCKTMIVNRRNNHMKKYIFNTLWAVAAMLTCTSCTDFIFGNEHIDYEDNPLDKRLMQFSGADKIADSLKNVKGTPYTNKDEGGAFNNWYNCLIMFKEGHKHGENMIHGNAIYPHAPYSQEEFAVVHNNAQWPTVEVLSKKNATFFEREAGKEGPKDYIRLIGGHLKRWGMVLYFFDKEGRLMNDDILNNSDQYQIFFTVSDLDDKGNPYEVMDCRGTWKQPRKKRADETDEEYCNEVNKDLSLVDTTPVPATDFAEKTTWEDRAAATPDVFYYEYRDTWQHDLMSDGARDMFNQKLLPPLDRNDAANGYVWDPDQDRVGLKGHITFGGWSNNELGWRDRQGWPYLIKSRRDTYIGTPWRMNRDSYLLPKFYLSVRIMKCEKGKKALIPAKAYQYGVDGLYRHPTYEFSSKFVCTDYNAPFRTEWYKEKGVIQEATQWTEVARFNIPIKVFCSSYDSDPTAADPYEPFYYYMGREMNLSPVDAMEAASGVQTNSIGGGRGFANWYL